SCQLIDAEGDIRLVRPTGRSLSPLYLFGAGHVGRAIVNAMDSLPFEIAWIDSRPEIFPEFLPDNVIPRPALDPLSEVGRAPAGAFFLVMTHEHDQDEQICERILIRGDFAYLGLIGSETKVRRFRMRLGGRDIPHLDRLICPIGLPGIQSKEPAIIAASVAADLLQRREHLQTKRSVTLGNATS
ncbi:MAG: xanthine dehydrogenase accessory protein XdhC, partial [Pseudomonadota bacterium]